MQKRREEREKTKSTQDQSKKWKEKDFTTAFFPLALGKTKF